MNKDRRNAIAKIAGNLADLLSEVESLKDEEQEYYDNMPESLQSGERGSAAEQAVSQFEDALNELQSAIDSLEAIE